MTQRMDGLLGVADCCDSLRFISGGGGDMGEHPPAQGEFWFKHSQVRLHFMHSTCKGTGTNFIFVHVCKISIQCYSD